MVFASCQYLPASLTYYRLLLSSPRITSASSLARTLIAQLEKCPSDNYVIVSQPGVNVADYSNPHSAPHLKQMTSGEDKNIRSSLIITDMMGAIDADEFVRAVEDKCGAVLLRVDASSKPPLLECHWSGEIYSAKRDTFSWLFQYCGG